MGKAPQMARKLPKGTRCPVDIVLDFFEGGQASCKLRLVDPFDIGERDCLCRQTRLLGQERLNAPAMPSSRGRDREFKADSRHVRLAITT